MPERSKPTPIDFDALQRTLLKPGDPFRAQELESIQGIRDPFDRHLFDRLVLPPLVFKQPQLLSAEKCDLLSKNGNPSARYLEFFLEMHDPVRRNKLSESFPLQARVHNILASENAKALFIVGEQICMGDELCDAATVMQALVDNFPFIQITCLTSRPHLYNHPQIETKQWRHNSESLTQFNFVLDCGNTGPYWLPPPTSSPPDIYIRPRSIRNAHPHMMIEGRQERLWQPFYDNVYTPGFMLCAEFGLPFRYGTLDPLLSVFIGNARKEEFREALTILNQEIRPLNIHGRPTAVWNPFGGSREEKGLPNTPQGDAQAVAFTRYLIDQGYFVLLLPNGQPWGDNARAARICSHFSSAECSTRSDLADKPTLFKYLVHTSDAVFSVEGGLMHLAYNLGKPIYILNNETSKDIVGRWAPLGFTSAQGIVDSPEEITLPRAKALWKAPQTEESPSLHATCDIGMLERLLERDSSNSNIDLKTNWANQLCNEIAFKLRPITSPPLFQQIIQELEVMAARQQRLIDGFILTKDDHATNRHIPPWIAESVEDFRSNPRRAILKTEAILQKYAASRLVGIWPSEDAQKLTTLLEAYHILPGKMAPGLLGSVDEAYSLRSVSIPRPTETLHTQLQQNLRAVHDLGAQFLWYYDHGIDIGITPQNVMKELIPLYAHLLPHLNSLIDLSNDKNIEPSDRKMALEQIVFGIFLLEEGFEKRDDLGNLLLNHSPESGHYFDLLLDKTPQFDAHYSQFIKSYQAHQRTPIMATHQSAQSEFQAVCLSHIWLPQPLRIHYRYDLFFNPDQKDNAQLRSLVGCFSGPEIKVHWPQVRKVKSFFEGCLMIGPGRIDRQRHENSSAT